MGQTALLEILIFLEITTGVCFLVNYKYRICGITVSEWNQHNFGLRTTLVIRVCGFILSFSSPEQMLKVSYCDHPLSVVRRQQLVY